MEQRTRNIIIAIVVIVILLAIGGGLYYFYVYKKEGMCGKALPLHAPKMNMGP